MDSHYAVNDSEWPEVKIINGYAVFMGYLMIGTRGLGVLVFTWTTVVLLGGFVSNLGYKDFWCLTGITLVQTAGVFTFILKEKVRDMMRSWFGLLISLFAKVQGNENGGRSEIRRKIAYSFAVFQGLALGIILFPLGILYMLGLYVSAGVSLWRLIEHDFGGTGNMKAGLIVLYSLAAAQGLLFGYKTIHGVRSRSLVPKFVAHWPGMGAQDLVAEYLEETVAGCEEDPSLATGRNFVTYGVGLLMEAKSDKGFLAGIRVLGGAIKDDSQPGRKVLAKHLLTRSDSSSHMIRRLLQAVGPRSQYSIEIRTHAARILALVARGIRLEQQLPAPGVIECISSVLDPSADEKIIPERRITVSSHIEDQLKEDYEISQLENFELQYLQEDHGSPGSPDFFSLSGLIEWLVQALRGTSESSGNQRQRQNTDHEAGLDGLLEQAVEIIHQLAVDEENRRVMTNAVLHKFAMAPLKLHRGNHDVILKNYWVQWLMAGIKEASSKWQIVDEGRQPAAPPAGGGGERWGKNIQDDEESALLEGGRRWGENIQDDEERAPPAGEVGRRCGENIQDDEEGERLLRSSMVDPVLAIAINNIKRTIKSIFDCPECGDTQKRQAIQILLYLSLDMSCIIMNSKSGRSTLKSILQVISSTNDDPNHWRISSFTNQVDTTIIKLLASQMLSGMPELPSLGRDEIQPSEVGTRNDQNRASASDDPKDMDTPGSWSMRSQR